MAVDQTRQNKVKAPDGAYFFAKKSPLRHVISVDQFSNKRLLNRLFGLANNFKVMPPAIYPAILKNRVVATLFYEPSTRTRLSFETAVHRLGGQVISTENAAQFSSAAKGETLEDSIRTLNGYADAIVLRHPQIGSARLAAEHSRVPIINAGDGAGQHPTQALLDLYTIRENKRDIDGLKIGLVGDLLNGRTIHSLIHLLSVYKPEIYLISPNSLRLPKNYLKVMDNTGVKYHQLDSWDEALRMVDVLYLTRVQKERFKSEAEYLRVKDDFIFDKKALARLNKQAIIMHPLPRVNEIAVEVDSDPRSIYFEQAKNGLFMRMALLAEIFST